MHSTASIYVPTLGRMRGAASWAGLFTSCFQVSRLSRFKLLDLSHLSSNWTILVIISRNYNYITNHLPQNTGVIKYTTCAYLTLDPTAARKPWYVCKVPALSSLFVSNYYSFGLFRLRSRLISCSVRSATTIELQRERALMVTTDTTVLNLL